MVFIYRTFKMICVIGFQFFFLRSDCVTNVDSFTAPTNENGQHPTIGSPCVGRAVKKV